MPCVFSTPDISGCSMSRMRDDSNQRMDAVLFTCRNASMSPQRIGSDMTLECSEMSVSRLCGMRMTIGRPSERPQSTETLTLVEGDLSFAHTTCD